MPPAVEQHGDGGGSWLYHARMKHPALHRCSAILLVLFLATQTSGEAIQVSSPNRQLDLALEIADLGDAKGCAVYSIAFKGKTVIARSRLGLQLADGALRDNLAVTRQTRSRADTRWKPVCGERSEYRDQYEQLDLELKEQGGTGRVMVLTIRAYDQGVALAYTLPKQAGLERVKIAQELTEFRFPGDPAAWAVYSAQGKYARVPLSQVKAGCERPMTLQLEENLYVALAEAKLVDYARMKLSPIKGTPGALVSALSSAVEAPLPLTTPWRVIMAAESPGALLENNFILLNLNDPCAIADTSWIKPGKIIREVTLTTAGGKACVDFAARRGLQYVEFDAGWYGNEYDAASDARAVNLDARRSKGPLDLQEVIRYADGKGIGIILYVNHLALEKQMAELFPLYRRWGVKGVKFGFVNVGSQQWTRWLHEGVRLAAQHRLMVDVHDEYRMTGYSRTYPNLMTAEGISGDETSPSNEQTLAVLFTRMLAGAADNTVCYYDKRVEANASHAYQLAKPVCLYSPWQFLYWYDRPPASPPKAGGAGNTETSTGDEPELEFYDRLPTVWDDTRVLQASIGEYALIARRSGDAWYIGFMNSGKDRQLDLPLTFLVPGRRYTAHVYSDDPAQPTRTKVRVDRIAVTSGSTLTCKAAARGGQAVRIEPQP